jgi:hypothetical protein
MAEESADVGGVDRHLDEQGLARTPIAPALVSEAVMGVVMRFAEEAAGQPSRQPEFAEALITLYPELIGLR